MYYLERCFDFFILFIGNTIWNGEYVICCICLKYYNKRRIAYHWKVCSMKTSFKCIEKSCKFRTKIKHSWYKHMRLTHNIPGDVDLTNVIAEYITGNDG